MKYGWYEIRVSVNAKPFLEQDMLDGASDDQGRSQFSAGEFHNELSLQPTGDVSGKAAGVAGHFRSEHQSPLRARESEARSRGMVPALAGDNESCFSS